MRTVERHFKLSKYRLFGNNDVYLNLAINHNTYGVGYVDIDS